jgi:hypothetical protein
MVGWIMEGLPVIRPELLGIRPRLCGNFNPVPDFATSFSF